LGIRRSDFGYPIHQFIVVIGGAAVKKNCVCGVTALLVFGVLYVAEAVADEMTMAPAAFITSPASSLAWTGFYIGGNGGFGWSSSSVSYSPNDAAAQAGTCGGVGKGKCIPSADYSTVGALAGGQVGFNWQINSVWLTGVEADYQWANLTGLGVSPFHLGNVAKLSMCSPPGRARFHQEGSPISALSAAHLVFPAHRRGHWSGGRSAATASLH
jgi:hypothetical protein